MNVLPHDQFDHLLTISTTDRVCHVEFAECQLPPYVVPEKLFSEIQSRVQSEQCQTIEFDVGKVTGMTSAWLGLIITPVRWNLKVIVVNASPRTRELFSRTSLDRVVEFRTNS